MNLRGVTKWIASLRQAIAWGLLFVSGISAVPGTVFAQDAVDPDAFDAPAASPHSKSRGATNPPAKKAPTEEDDPFGDLGTSSPPKTPQQLRAVSPANDDPFDDNVFGDPQRNAAPQRGRFSNDPANERVAPPRGQNERPRNSSDRTRRRTEITLDEGASINPEVLRGVVDTTRGLSPEDGEPYFRILDLAARVDVEALNACAMLVREQRIIDAPRYASHTVANFPVFTDLFYNSDLYRGQPVTVRGHVRRLVDYDPGENEFDIRRVYEAWIYASDSQGHPVVAVFTRKPTGLLTGGNINEEVEVTGYYFKSYGYRAQDTTRKAPMVLAGEAIWYPRPRASSFISVSPWAYLWLSLMLLLVMQFVWHFGYRGSRKTGRPELRDYEDLPARLVIPTGDIPFDDHSDRSPLH